MRKVLFDARWIAPGMTGVGRVALEILRGVPEADRPATGLLWSSQNPVPPDLTGFRIHSTRVALTRHPVTDLYEQIGIPWLCARHGYKAFVSFEGRLPVFHVGFRTYGYVHDATFISLWRHNGVKYTGFLWAHLAAMRLFATGIVTVSEAAKSRLTKLARLAPRKVFVIRNADSGLDRVLAVRPADMPDRPYVLAVGMSNPRKNFLALSRGFALFNRSGAYDLVVTGAREPLEKMRAQANDPRIRNAGYVSEGELRYLYEHAACVAYPSVEEGFGIPLLDARLRGAPVACSDLDVFREVLGDQGTYFDPNDPGSIARGLAQAIADSANRSGGEILREKFSWGRSARSLLALARTGTPETGGG